MESILDAISRLSPDQLAYEPLGQWIRQLDFSSMNHGSLLPKVNAGSNCARSILCTLPLECVVTCWSPAAQSSVYQHKGFWGYMAVLQGVADIVDYVLSDNELYENNTIRCTEGGVLPEQGQTIRKIVNMSQNEPLVMVHLYPALKACNEVNIFDLERGLIGILDGGALPAFWTDSASSFKETHEDIFDLVLSPNQKSHEIALVIPKPKPNEIHKMISEYYNEQANEYDKFDESSQSRAMFKSGMNKLIVKGLRDQVSLESLLAVACGTGKRQILIRKASELDYKITGIELSVELCARKCQAPDFELHNRNFIDAELGKQQFEAVTFLYAFAHLCSHEERLEALKKIRYCLKPDGFVYVDVFNIYNRHEWCGYLPTYYDELSLGELGYEWGDVFYRKKGNKSISYLHYFTLDYVQRLFAEAGFSDCQVTNIGSAYRIGEVLPDSSKEGAFLIRASPK